MALPFDFGPERVFIYYLSTFSYDYMLQSMRMFCFMQLLLWVFGLSFFLASIYAQTKINLTL